MKAAPKSVRGAATEATTYQCVSANLVASGFLRQNDVGIVGYRYADSETFEVHSMNVDTRCQFGHTTGTEGLRYVIALSPN